MGHRFLILLSLTLLCSLAQSQNCTNRSRDCLECGMVDSRLQCVQCNIGQYLDKSYRCQNCSDNCLFCQYNAETAQPYCLECVEGKKYTSLSYDCGDNRGQCDVSVCERCIDFYNDTNIINHFSKYTPTSQIIQQYTGNLPRAIEICSQCKLGYELNSQNQCVLSPLPPCPLGNYRDPASRRCLSCSQNITNCFKCTFGFFFDGIRKPICQLCAQGFYYEQGENRCVRQNFTHTRCPRGCVNCTYGVQTLSCLTCVNGYRLNSQTQLCDLICNRTGYENCVRCREGPIIGEGFECLECSRLYFAADGKCSLRRSCNKTDYFNILTQRCLTCSDNCDNCDIQRDPGIIPRCLKCSSNFRVNQLGQCTRGAPECPEGCGNCTILDDGSAFCSRCIDRYRQSADNRSCILNCPSNCQLCSLVSNTSRCYKCVEGFQLNRNFDCIQSNTCPNSNSISRYLDTISGTSSYQCQNCPEQCNTCFLDGIELRCRTCKSPNFRLTNTGNCVDLVNGESNCPEFTFFTSPNICNACNIPNCKICTQSLCNECLFGFELINNRCYKQTMLTRDRPGCSEWYQDERLKRPICISCINQNDWILDQLQGRCLSRTCPDRQVFSNRTLECVSCPKNCALCFLDISNNPQCVLCEQGYSNTNGTCSFSDDQCPIQTMADPSIEQCLECPPGCNRCAYKNDTKKIICTECSSGFAKLTNSSEYCQSNQCRNESKILGYSKTDNGFVLQCISCDQGCLACDYDFIERKQMCQECVTGYLLNETTQICLLQDPSAFTCQNGQIRYTDINGVLRCSACPVGCKSCFYDTTKIAVLCEECEEDFIINSASYCDIKVVTENCTSRQYFSYETRTCEPCPTTCLSCQFNSLSASPKIACLSCNTSTFALNSLRCERICGNFQIMRLLSNGTQNCEKCPISNCQTCANLYSADSVEIRCITCARGYFFRDGNCVQIQGNCTSDQYTQLVQGSSGQWTVQCARCPLECQSCVSTDPQDLRAAIRCNSCRSTSTLDSNGNCIPNKIMFPQNCTKATQIYALNLNRTIGRCVDCPTNCNRCTGFLTDVENETRLTCLECLEDFYLSMNRTCVRIRACDQGLRAQLIVNTDTNTSFSCVRCRSDCADCRLTNLNDELTYTCITCREGLTLQNGVCRANSTQNIQNTNCGAGLYAVLVSLQNNSRIIACQKCPSGCSFCSAAFNNSTNTQAAPTCSNCTDGFTFDNATRLCVQRCGQRSYLNPNTSRCAACDLSCATCKGPLSTDCLTCASGLTLSVRTGLCSAEESEERKLCLQSVGTIWDSQILRCVCQRDNFFYNSTSRACENLRNRQCSSGEYLRNGTCLSCATMNKLPLCEVCTGPSTLECVKCVKGYFYSKDSGMCQQCTNNCDSCSSGSNICDSCAPGTYMVRGSTSSVTCEVPCPVGTLPFSGSIYQLNPDIFTKDQLRAALGRAEEFRRRTNYSIYASSSETALGIGEAMQPLFSKNDFSYQVDSLETPTFQSQKIVVACLPCIYNCGGFCADGYLWDDDAKMCLFEKCRDGYKINSVGKVCERIQQGQFVIKSIMIYSLDLASNTQPLERHFFAEALISTNASVAYTWSIQSAQDIVTGEALDEVELKLLSDRFFFGVNVNQTNLRVPASNLDANLMIQLIIRTNITISSSISFRTASGAIAQTNGTRMIESLGLRPSNMYVTPEVGTSGETRFQAGWDFTGVEAFKRSGGSSDTLFWTFLIRVGDYYKFSSTQLIYQAEFTIPSTNTNPKVLVEFIATRGNQRFRGEINIQASPASSPTNIQNNTLVRRALDSTQVKSLSYQEVVNVGAELQNNIRSVCPTNITEEQKNLLKTRGPCVIGQNGSCCGNGVCTKGLITDTVCKCQRGFKGIFCEFREDMEKETSTTNAFKNVIENLPTGSDLTVEQQSTILNVVRSAAESRIVENDIVVQLINKLDNLKLTTQNQDQLSDYLKALKEVKEQNFRNYQRDSNNPSSRRFLSTITDEFKEREKSLKNQELESTRAYLSANLDSKRGDTELEFEFENLKGRAQIVDTTLDEHIQKLQASNSNGAVNIQSVINKEAFPGTGGEKIVEFIITDSIITTATRANRIIDGKNYELSIYDSSKTLLNISDVKGNCPILIQLPVPKANNPKSLLNCTYYDEQTNAYTTKGLTLQSIVDSGDNFIINCCTTHLTSFAAIKLESTNIGDETSSPILKTLSITVLFSLILSILI